MKKYLYKLETTKADITLSLTFYEVDSPKAIIQVIHGMAEHQARYDELAINLCHAGYNVVTSDLRGHGSSINNESELGYFGAYDGELKLVEDQKIITKFILSKYPSIKVYIFAHSMGTLIARNYLQKNDVLIDKVILCGAPDYKFIAPVGKAIASLKSRLSGKKNHSNLLKALTTGGFNKCVKNSTSENDWISYSAANVKAYNTDSLCGFTFTNEGYKNLIGLMINMHKAKSYDLNNKILPILFIAGEDDPCIGRLKGLASSINTLKKAGYENIDYKLYPLMRHEIINEDEKATVFTDIIKFFNE